MHCVKSLLVTAKMTQAELLLRLLAAEQKHCVVVLKTASFISKLRPSRLACPASYSVLRLLVAWVTHKT